MNKTGTQTIETQRLILRRFRIEDADDMFNNWASDPEVTRFLTWPPHPGVEVTRSLLAEWISDYEDGGYFNWVMEYKETGKVIGNISVVKLHEDIEAADIGYCMSRAYWGQGLMSEALRRVMDYLFDVVGLNRVAACHDVDNPGSGRVMDKAGMTREGILRQAGKNNLGIHDVVWHGVIRRDLSKTSDGLSYIIRKMRADETALLKDFLYEAIFIPEGVEAPARDIVEKPELRVYTDDFGAHPGDNCLVAEADGRVVGAVWTRIMNDYGHIDDETPSFAISLYSEYRGQGIGSQLMVGMLDLLGSQGYERASLAVQKANYAVRMYKNVGFKTVDENDEEYIMVWERHTSGNDDPGKMKTYYDDGTLKIRSMLPEDAKILYDTYLSYGWHPQIKIYEDYYKEQEAGDRLVFVAEYEGAVKGQCTLVLHPTEGPWGGKNIPEIVDLTVFFDIHGKGIGSRLLDVAESEAARLSDTVFLAVGVHSGYGPAQRIYVKRGYIPDGSGVWYRNKVLDQYAPCVNDDDLLLFMSKKLTGIRGD